MPFGGVQPEAGRKKSRVPQDWDGGTDILFYQRVDNPLADEVNEVFEAALEIVKERKEEKGKGDNGGKARGDDGSEAEGGKGGRKRKRQRLSK